MSRLKIFTSLLLSSYGLFAFAETYQPANPPANQSSFRWDLNDVSYLMPLPEKIGPDHLLRYNSEGNGGELLPAAFIKNLPQLTAEMDASEIRENLRVVAVRLDPCFPADPPLLCKKQLRFVLQILRPGPRGITETIDAAFHVFYTLNDLDFADLILDIKNWKQAYAPNLTGLPLQIHPAWKQQLDKSPSLIPFQNIVTKYAGPKTISRVTAMTVRNLGQTWGFVGADVVDGKFEYPAIPRVKSRAQIFINQANSTDTFLGQISPRPGSPDDTEIFDTLNNIITNSQSLLTENEQIIQDELKSIYRIENPKIFNPNNMDCVSCHTAGPAREWVSKKRGDIKGTEIFSQNAYQNFKYNLANTSNDVTNTQIIRAFGYFGSGSAISQRVINESAEVADALNGISLKKSMRSPK